MGYGVMLFVVFCSLFIVCHLFVGVFVVLFLPMIAHIVFLRVFSIMSCCFNIGLYWHFPLLHVIFSFLLLDMTS